MSKALTGSSLRGRKKRLFTLLQQAVAHLNKASPDIAKALNGIKDAQELVAGSKKTVAPKKPSQYNLFVRRTMSELKNDKPDLTNLERMSMCAQRWRDSKTTAVTASA